MANSQVTGVATALGALNETMLRLASAKPARDGKQRSKGGSKQEGLMNMKNLIVYWADEHWYGSEVNWKRSGSGSYREITPIEIPQTKAEIERFAAENKYSIEWRKPIPEETRPTEAAAG